MLKRSLSIAGHRTSIALEPEFWDGLVAMAVGQHISLPAMIEIIDSERQGTNLSSAIRVAVLAYYQQQA